MVELIARLLVQQRVDFILKKTLEPMQNGLLVGKLMFTSFFATRSQDQDPFSTHELVPILFNRGKNRNETGTNASLLRARTQLSTIYSVIQGRGSIVQLYINVFVSRDDTDSERLGRSMPLPDSNRFKINCLSN